MDLVLFRHGQWLFCILPVVQLSAAWGHVHLTQCHFLAFDARIQKTGVPFFLGPAF